jgi:hypothetical protein
MIAYGLASQLMEDILAMAALALVMDTAWQALLHSGRMRPSAGR